MSINDSMSLDRLRKLQENERKYYTLFNNISDAIFTLSTHKDSPGKIIEVNNNAIGLTGFTREELITMHINDIKPKELHYQVFKVTEEIKNNDSFFFESTVRSKDNKVIPVEVNSRQVEIDGEKVHIAVVRDVSERLKAQETLRESEEMSRMIVQFAPFGAFIHTGYEITVINETGVKLLGFSRYDQIIGKKLRTLVLEEDWAVLDEMINTMHIKGLVGPRELRFIHADGSSIQVEMSTTQIIFKGNKVSLSYIKDITKHKSNMEEKQRLLEQALDYDMIKTEFFSNISHELRTPLNIILSSIQLTDTIYEQKNEDLQRFFSTYEKYIGVMRQNSYRLLKLINNLIDMTRIDTGFLNVELCNQDIIGVIENITMSVVPYLETKGITLTFDTETEEKITAFDENKMERILLNLLSNAAKFTKAGGRINVNIHDEGECIMISVKDTGCGIPTDKLEVIFERFRQVDTMLTRRAEGSGIGLSLVKALVEAHEGSIVAKSIVGEGSEFIIRIPVKLIKEEADKRNFLQNSKSNQDKIERINIEFSDIYA